MSAETFLIPLAQRINTQLTAFLDARFAPRGQHRVEQIFEEAIRYGLLGSGKRLRPILAIIAYEQVSGKVADDAIVRSVLGLECLHAYTLVHDDLPCMDNDELRRGKPTVWKQYGEATALLVGDALQTLGFECLAASGNARVIYTISRALGDPGVVRGQVKDMAGEGFVEGNIDRIYELEAEKTGVFLVASLECGALLANADDTTLQKLKQYGMCIGKTFQMTDDLLDAEGDPQTVGKTLRKDANQKKGLVRILGIETVKHMVEETTKVAVNLAQEMHNTRLAELAEYIANRKK